MNIFKRTTFTWFQVSMLKFAVLFVGIAIGARWPEIFAQYAVLLLVIALVLSVYLGIVWARQR